MSSYLTGWQSQQNLCLQDIYGLSTSLNTINKCKSLNISTRVTPKRKKENKKPKYFLPTKKNSTLPEHRQKKEINIVAFNPYFKKFKSKINSQAKLQGKFLKNKQNMENQLTKKSINMRNKIIKPNSEVKFSVVNVFERLDFQKPEPVKYINEVRKKQLSLHKSEGKKSVSLKTKIKQMPNERAGDQKYDRIAPSRSPNKFKYINLTSFQVIYNEKNGYKFSRFDKLHKIASDCCLRKYI